MISQLIEWFFVRARMEKLACPYCMENNKALMLTNGGKTFFYYHRHFFPMNHRYKKNKKDFFVSRVEKDVAPPRLSSEELHDVVSRVQ